jgi:cytochrome c oxidase assembly protein subunit 11
MDKNQPRQQSETVRANGKVVRRLVLVAMGMFGFGFAMVPLYSVFCDLTGFGGRSVQQASDNANIPVSDRRVRVRFLASMNSGLPWVFQPMEKSSTVKLGAMAETKYLAMNPTHVAMAGQAVYNVVPPEAGLYFVKTECFCFTQQLLSPQESREMPVHYFIHPDLPESIREITLSYTFYRQDNEPTANTASAVGQN